ncbi:MAG: hypothetical protein CVV27_08225 [Candidatus Melainabacteria bacterium HGW-Melainabacteria-1]|nr:MAG: hypothetical protein CVV27_08225 [Candidatus Melainabacteria bacterium HGW-Melainabacteria-1]
MFSLGAFGLNDQLADGLGTGCGPGGRMPSGGGLPGPKPPGGMLPGGMPPGPIPPGGIMASRLSGCSLNRVSSWARRASGSRSCIASRAAASSG